MVLLPSPPTSTKTKYTWTQQPSFVSNTLAHVASNGNFSQVMAGQYPGSLWTTFDKGATWSNATSPPGGPRYWSSVEASGDGQVWLATAQGEYLWVSVDGGQSWTAQMGLGDETRYGNSMGNWTDCNVSPVRCARCRIVPRPCFFF